MTPDKKAVPVEQHVFAKNFKMARQFYDLTQMQISKATGLTQDYISNVERCVAGIGLDSMAVMSQAVSIPLYFLLRSDFQSSYSFDDKDKIWKTYPGSQIIGAKVPYERTLFGINFKAARHKARMTQVEIAKFTDFTADALVYVEKAETSLFLSTASKLALSVGSTVHALLTP